MYTFKPGEQVAFRARNEWLTGTIAFKSHVHTKFYWINADNQRWLVNAEEIKLPEEVFK